MFKIYIVNGTLSVTSRHSCRWAPQAASAITRCFSTLYTCWCEHDRLVGST